MSPRRFDVWWCNLDPTVGTEIHKARPVVIVSPDELNRHYPWFMVAPMTTGAFAYGARVPTRFDNRDAHVVVDQMRCVDRARLGRRLGELDEPTRERLLGALAAYFAR